MRSVDEVQWTDDESVRITGATLTVKDLEWLEPVRRLTLWSVRMPDGLLARMPNLEWVDVRSATATSAGLVDGCAGLRYLALHHVRGIHDLSVLTTLTSLELMSLYSMPRVIEIPSLAPMSNLRRIELGSMKHLGSIAPVLDAPLLRELLLIRAVGHDEHDAERIRDAAGLDAFEWFAEDVPLRVWVPFMETAAKPKARAMHPNEWFAGGPDNG